MQKRPRRRMPEGLGPTSKAWLSKGTQWFQVNMFKGICVMFHDSLL